MQQRFCTCGFMVLVDYIVQSSAFACRFFSRTADGHHQHAHRVTTCPCCGRALDINALR